MIGSGTLVVGRAHNWEKELHVKKRGQGPLGLVPLSPHPAEDFTCASQVLSEVSVGDSNLEHWREENPDRVVGSLTTWTIALSTQKEVGVCSMRGRNLPNTHVQWNITQL